MNPLAERACFSQVCGEFAARGGRAQAVAVKYTAGLLTQGVPGVPQDPLAPRRRPLGSSPDRNSAVGNVPALLPR